MRTAWVTGLIFFIIHLASYWLKAFDNKMMLFEIFPLPFWFPVLYLIAAYIAIFRYLIPKMVINEEEINHFLSSISSEEN